MRASDIAPLLCVVAALLAATAMALGDDADTSQLLSSGEYKLRLLMPMTAEDRNKDVTFPAKVKIDGNTLSIDIERALGKSITLEGLSSGTAVKFGTTEPERDTLVTLHFVGMATSEVHAEGVLAIFVDGEKVENGKWTLTKQAAEEK